MIRITSISGLRNETIQFDEIWAIVRSLKNPIEGVRQVDILAPSKKLFFEYRRLVNEGRWDRKAFEEMYVPQFLWELKSNGKNGVWDALNYLYKADKDGKNVALVCFCTDETLCHRSVVGGLLQAVGCNVVMDTKIDYSAMKQLMDGIQGPALAEGPLKQPARGAFRGEFYFLSNMYPASVTIQFFGEPVTFTCAEAAYQASKCPERVQEFTGIDGYAAKALGKTVQMAPGFEYGKVQIMQEIVTAKFLQNPELMDKLQRTTGPLIEENNWGDTFWGCVNGKGENHLGLILMRIRDRR